MSMLTFVGLGIYDEKDISLKGLEAVKQADLVFAEFYTSPLAGRRLERMEEIYGKKIIVLNRKDLEEKAEEGILKEAKDKNVVLLSAGDPMIATTHVDLMLRAMEMGIKTRVIHASSIFSAVAGVCGLQIYKFGRSATVSPPFGSTISEVPYETVLENRRRGLHTLLFLDVGMKIPYALELLEEVERRRERAGKEAGILKEVLFIGVARAGSETQVVKADYADALKHFDFGEPPHVLVAVGELHFMEKEALVRLASAPISSTPI